MKYIEGDVVSLKKGHPCGENTWKILSAGADIKLKCLGCERIVWFRRFEFNKMLRKIQNEEGKMISVVNFERKEK